MNRVSFWLYCVGGSIAAVSATSRFVLAPPLPIYYAIEVAFFAAMFVIQTIRLNLALTK
jgi:hypothetical protein